MYLSAVRPALQHIFGPRITGYWQMIKECDIVTRMTQGENSARFTGDVYHTRELTSQELYVEELTTQAEALRISPHAASRLSSEDAEFLGQYCEQPSKHGKPLREGVIPLHRADVLEPLFASGLRSLAAEVDGNPESSHWYTKISETRDRPTPLQQHWSR